ncbi:hypothetical protein D6201_07390 [Aurantiacibacter aquimixticola]|uniref:Uncharacterized protein n=1 Tax=Aurantiacibacter aquimixticola TaxID=1958945 RepID=A0A419RTT9_9SPHN|nr:hypothetical protein D6201_07390 [Aurantiacibacter aquimixticola]
MMRILLAVQSLRAVIATGAFTYLQITGRSPTMSGFASFMMERRRSFHPTAFRQFSFGAVHDMAPYRSPYKVSAFKSSSP